MIIYVVEKRYKHEYIYNLKRKISNLDTIANLVKQLRQIFFRSTQNHEYAYIWMHLIIGNVVLCYTFLIKKLPPTF